jgi:pimeloyl-ACP methyl ester carboxylesterase
VSDLFVEEVGQGPRVLLVHGSGGREATWADQRRLAGQYRLAMPDRRGYGDSSGGAPGFHHDAADIAALLGDGAHVVGFSYGGIGCLLAAARRPRAVRSLTLI